MRLPQVLGRDPVDPFPEAPRGGLLVHVIEVGVQESFQQLAHGRADPGRDVDTVGDAQDLARAEDGRPGPVGRCRMQLADGVGAVGEAQREGGHVELAAILVDAQAELQDALYRHAASVGPLVAVEQGTRDASDKVYLEALVAGRDGRVDGEDAVGPDRLPGRIQRLPRGDELAGPFGQAGTRSDPR